MLEWMVMAPNAAAKDASSIRVDDAGGKWLGWRMVVLALCSQTCAVGLAYGINGSFVTWIQSEFHTTRALASAGMPAILMVQALVAPVVGDQLRRLAIRTVMMMGALIFAIGHLALFFVGNIYMYLAIYACLMGPAYCMLTHVATSTLVVNWFGDRRGRALGIANIPVALLVFPPIVAAIMLALGHRAVFLAGTMISLALIPLLTFVVSRPADAESSLMALKALGRDDVPPGRLLTRREMMRQPTFWLILLGNGIFVAAGATMAIVLVPFAQAKNVGLEWAAVALSCYGLGSMIGSPTWGYIVDRIGPSRTFVALAAIEATMWGCLFLFGNSAMVIMLVGGLVGFCSGGAAVPLLTATIGIWVDRQNFSRALGLLYLLKLPFSAGMPILSGIIFDFLGSYQMLLLIFVGLMALNIILFWLFEVRPFSAAEKGRL
jgi:MFS family permease